MLFSNQFFWKPNLSCELISDKAYFCKRVETIRSIHYTVYTPWTVKKYSHLHITNEMEWILSMSMSELWLAVYSNLLRNEVHIHILSIVVYCNYDAPARLIEVEGYRTVVHTHILIRIHSHITYMRSNFTKYGHNTSRYIWTSTSSVVGTGFLGLNCGLLLPSMFCS